MPEASGDDQIRAAGALAWRPGPSGPQLALVHRPKYDDWSYPKGKSEPGEHPLMTAIREVAEETGLRVVIGRSLRPSVYEVGGRPKYVRYWVARVTGSAGFMPGHEVDQLDWADAAEVASRLSYQRDVALLDEFGSHPADSAPLILLRHAEAGVRCAGAADLERPLGEQGTADAKLLASLLAAYAPRRVLSSAAERCLATVRPYAEAAGLAIEIEPALTVAGGRQPGAEAARFAEWQVAELAASGESAVLCVHRENLPRLANAARAALGTGPDDGPPLAKGAFIVLQSAAGKLVGAERHDLVS
ncbi:MAG TPA: NUDIX domain-containing protein [Streptosporangiaceae bacterium]|nr:NUDIX domain-containing protein [Streptosporangiaceae bacterium]